MDQQIAQDVERLKHWAFGNGTPGADERLRRLDATHSDLLSNVKSLKRELREFREERRVEKASNAGTIKGIRWTLYGALIILGGGGGILGTRILTMLDGLRTALP